MEERHTVGQCTVWVGFVHNVRQLLSYRGKFSSMKCFTVDYFLICEDDIDDHFRGTLSKQLSRSPRQKGILDELGRCSLAS